MKVLGTDDYVIGDDGFPIMQEAREDRSNVYSDGSPKFVYHRVDYSSVRPQNRVFGAKQKLFQAFQE